MAEAIIHATEDGGEKLTINGMQIERLYRQWPRVSFIYRIEGAREQIDTLALPTEIPFPVAPKRVSYWNGPGYTWANFKSIKGRRLRVNIDCREPLQRIELLFANAAHAAAPQKRRWKHLDAKVAEMEMPPSIRLVKALERPEYPPSQLKVDEDCVSPYGVMMRVTGAYGEYCTECDGLPGNRLGYIVLHPEHGRLFAQAGSLLDQAGRARYLQLV